MFNRKKIIYLKNKEKKKNKDLNNNYGFLILGAMFGFLMSVLGNIFYSMFYFFITTFF